MRKHTASAKITQELARTANGSFSVVYRALSEEAKERGRDKALDQKSVEKRIRAIMKNKDRRAMVAG